MNNLFSKQLLSHSDAHELTVSLRLRQSRLFASGLQDTVANGKLLTSLAHCEPHQAASLGSYLSGMLLPNVLSPQEILVNKIPSRLLRLAVVISLQSRSLNSLVGCSVTFKLGRVLHDLRTVAHNNSVENQ